MHSMEQNNLIASLRACRLCKDILPLGPRPVFQLEHTAKLLIAAQAPGLRVHKTGIPFNDPSGNRLRDWMGIGREAFYDARNIAIIPMGLCYPGTKKAGDLPPPPRCALTWRQKMLDLLPNLELVLVIGRYAHAWHLKGRQKENLTKTVEAWRDYWPEAIPLPHPSPRNNLWLRKNPWFGKEVLPPLQEKIRGLLSS